MSPKRHRLEGLIKHTRETERGRQADRRAGRQADRQTDRQRQADRDRQTERTRTRKFYFTKIVV